MRGKHLNRALGSVQVSKAAQIALLHAVVAAAVVLVLDLAVVVLGEIETLPVVEVCCTVQVTIRLPAANAQLVLRGPYMQSPLLRGPRYMSVGSHTGMKVRHSVGMLS